MSSKNTFTVGETRLFLQCFHNASPVLTYRCEASGETDPYLQWLVSDRRGLLYRNLFCAICHGVPPEAAIYWLARIHCGTEYYSKLNTSESGREGNMTEKSSEGESLQQQLITGECEIKFSPPTTQATEAEPDENTQIRKGKRSDVTSTTLAKEEHTSEPSKFPTPPQMGFRTCKAATSLCSDGWLQDETSERQCVAHLCESARASSYVYTPGRWSPRRIFKNSHCARCNFVPEKILMCHQNPQIMFKGAPPFYPLSIVIDLNNGGGASVDTLVGYELSEEKLETVTRTLSCPDDHVFDPFQKTCIPLTCSPGFVYVNRECRDISIARVGELDTGATDCARIAVADFFILENGSLYVNSSGALFDPDLYEVTDNGTILLCSHFSQNYTSSTSRNKVRKKSLCAMF